MYSRGKGTAPTDGGLPWREAVGYFILALALDVVVGLGAGPNVLQGHLVDTDTLMRLVRLRDILARHAPLHAVLRDDSGSGTVLHWSHLLDSVLLLIGAPLRLWLSWDRALRCAAMALGPVSVGLLGMAAAWATAPLADRSWRWAAPVLAALSPPIIGYGLPGVADHHVLLALGAVVMAGATGRLAAGDTAAALILGTSAATSIWISPEAMPFAVAAFGGLALAWLLRPSVPSIGIGIALAATAFLTLIATELTVDPPAGGYWSVAIDRISTTYLLLTAILAAVAWSLYALDRARIGRRIFWRGVLGASVAAVGLLLWLALFPIVLRGPEALSNTAELRTMFDTIQEMLPLESLTKRITFLLNGGAAVTLIVWFSVRDRSAQWKSMMWVYAALCLVGTEVLGQLHMRFTIYPNAAAAMMLPLGLTECTRVLSRHPPRVQAISRLTILTIAFFAMQTNAIATVLGVADKGPPLSDRFCDLQGIGSSLKSLAGEVILADVNDVPALLYNTDVKTVGSLFHSNIAGYNRLRAAWRSGPSEAEPFEVRETRATYLLYCRHSVRSGLVADLPEQTLWDRLDRGDVPGWLHPVTSGAHAQVTLYRIVNTQPQ